MKLKPFLFIVACTLGLTGCVPIRTSDIHSVKIRFVGMMVGENPINQTPEVYFGYGSIVYQKIPTSTNGPIYAPRYFDTFELGSSAVPFSTKIVENTGTGDVSIGTNGTSQAIIPKLNAMKVIRTNTTPILESPKNSGNR